MTEKYLLLNDEIYIFHPDTHEVFRVNPERIERFDHTEMMMALRLSATEITRQQAEHAVPTLDLLHGHLS